MACEPSPDTLWWDLGGIGIRGIDEAQRLYWFQQGEGWRHEPLVFATAVQYDRVHTRIPWPDEFLPKVSVGLIEVTPWT